jgi:hypothetical protein
VLVLLVSCEDFDVPVPVSVFVLAPDISVPLPVLDILIESGYESLAAADHVSVTVVLDLSCGSVESFARTADGNWTSLLGYRLLKSANTSIRGIT